MLRYPGEETTARRWLADVGTLGEEVSRYATVIEPFVAEAAAEIRPQLDDRPPLLELNVAGDQPAGARVRQFLRDLGARISRRRTIMSAGGRLAAG